MKEEKTFDPVSNRSNFPQMERETLKYWEENRIFEKSVEQREGASEFVFYDGPPFATGLPHYGHLLAGTIKDVVPRYQTMRGKKAGRVFGWDCHGLPVEYEMEKELKLSGKKEIEDYGIGKFNEACRGIVLRYTKEWENVVRRMGRWVDFENGYRTMDLTYMESIWWVFKQLWDSGLIYEGYKILPYCPRCSTPLSNFEANQGYMEVIDPAITIRFQSADTPDEFFLAWTTTPWTLPSNLALAAGPDIDYVKVKDGDSYYILAAARLDEYYKKEKPEIVSRFKGKELEGRKYLPLFPYFSDFAEKGAFRVINADFVSTGDGTGIVHMAPGFGEDDAEAAKKYNIPDVCPIDEECKFTKDVPDYQGRYVKDCDKDIIQRLKEEKKLIHRGTIAHNYPHCWRDDSPLIYKAVSTWFVRIDLIKEKMLAANSQINWVPDHLKDGRFGKWLENARDWAVSRNRYWGCPLPIWRNKETGEAVCVGSVAELEKLSGKKIDDIHKHFVDDIEIASPAGNASLKRVPEVLDCWFESGSMPYAQQHYPFENKEHFEANFPADFIAEGLDQTRGWFYTLVVLGAALFDKPAFRNVVVNGLVLAEDGQKMSKRKKNYPDPMAVIDSYGADALRLFMLGSQVVRGEDLKFSEDGVKDVLRKVILPIWNSYSFFVTYANVDQWQPEQGEAKGPENPSNPLDRWILSSLSQMIEEIRLEMDGYHLQKAANRFEKFVDDLTNWYIRRSRRRFWKSQNDNDKSEAYQTLHYVLISFAKTAAPFIPFITEIIYKNLRTSAMPDSVHLCDYPEPELKRRDVRLERQMEYTMTAVSLGRYLRTQHSLKVRQPLKKAVIVVHNDKIRSMLSETADIIAEELNVKSVELQSDESSLVNRSVKANFKKLGPKLGNEMKEASNKIAALSNKDVSDILSGKSVPLTLSSGTVLDIVEEDLIVQRQEKDGMTVATEKVITVALDTNIDRILEEEGFAREFVSRIQNMRKDQDFDVTDRIKISCSIGGNFRGAVSNFKDYICNETLCLELSESMEGVKDPTVCDINGVECLITIEKSTNK
ncbi:MAG: isoleucine--tRNA ligase [Lentisphaerae bacterium GWF2_45_14]|nr:MAG: isoleucine--tRNA ligase [Lentisphaerae bacterium GWF2_45_14]